MTTKGRFELVREIGRGGFGIVYEAIDLHRDQRVALKVLRRDRPSRLSALKGEFRALRGITHPNLVLLFDLVAEGEDWSFSMELVDGLGFLEYVWPVRDVEPVASATDFAQSLVTTLAQRGGAREQGGLRKPDFTLDLGRLRLAMGQLALGVNALHRARKLHRDIKPSNIRITPEGRLVLLDYGLVADVDPDGRVGVGQSVAGTYGYMAPEQTWGQGVTEASDWYSVGAVLHEALTGAKPGQVSQAALEEWGRGRPPEGLEQDADPSGDLKALCCRLLRKEPSARPVAKEVLAVLGGRRRSGAAALPHGECFVGRRAELEALGRAFELTASGKSVCARVSGASGLGKTVLCAHFLDQAKARDPNLVVLKGRCYEREEVPYKALDAVVDGLASHLIGCSDLEAAELLPRDFSALARLFRVLDEVPRPPAPRQIDLSTLEAQDLRRLAFGALRELVGRLVDRRTLVLWIDDAQWGDEDGAALLIELLRPPRSPSLLLLVSHRDGEPSRFLSRLEEWLGDPHSVTELTDVRLGKLPPDEARELGRVLLPGASDDDSVGRLCGEADGSPLFMQQLAAAGHLPVHSSDEPGPTLASVMQATLRALPEEARSLMEVVALSGRPIPASTALSAAGAPRDGLAIITRLAGQRLLTDAPSARGERVEAYHDKIREVAVAGLAPERRRAIHAALAATIEAGPESERDPDALLVHHSGSGDVRRAAEYALVAAERAESTLAFAHAAELYGLVLGWCRGTDRDTPEGNRELNRRRAKALANTGRGKDSAEAYLEVAEGAPGLEALECRRLAAEQLFANGLNDEALRVLEPVLRRVGVSFPSSGAGAVWRIAYYFARLLLRGVELRARTRLDADPLSRFRLDVAWTAAVGLSSVNPVVATALVLQHLNLALAAGDRRHACLSLPSFGALWLVSGSQGGLRRGTKLLEKGEALAKEVDDPLLHGLIGVFASTRLMVVGDWPEALKRIEGSLAALEARSTGVRYWYTVALGMRLQMLESLGRVNELKESAARWEEEAVVSKDLLGQLYASLFTALGLLAADDLDGARRRADGALAGWTAQAGFSAQHLFALRISVCADLYVGATSTAHERVLEAWPALKASQLLRVQSTRLDIVHLRARATLARASAGGSEQQRLLRDVEQIARRMEKELRRDVAPLVSLLRAGVARLRGDTASALGLVEQSLPGFDSVRMDVYAACARRIKGGLVGGREGDAMVKEADALMKNRGIVEPARWIAILAPGFPR